MGDQENQCSACGASIHSYHKSVRKKGKLCEQCKDALAQIESLLANERARVVASWAVRTGVVNLYLEERNDQPGEG